MFTFSFRVWLCYVGECEIELEGYCDASVTVNLMVSSQVQGSGLGLFLGVQ